MSCDVLKQSRRELILWTDGVHQPAYHFALQPRKFELDCSTLRLHAADDLRELKQDEVVVATGALPKFPDIRGVNGDNIATALEILSEQKTAGETVVIIGGGMIGCETAQFLVEKGKKVTILEMLERVGADIGRTNRWVVMQELRKAGVHTETKAEAIEITPNGVIASRNDESEFFAADTVVIAAGMIPDQELVQHLQGQIPNLHLIGDCNQPARIRHAIEAGLQVARQL